MGILVMIISLCIVTAVVVASVTAVIGGIAGSELDEEEQILQNFIRTLKTVTLTMKSVHVTVFFFC